MSGAAEQTAEQTEQSSDEGEGGRKKKRRRLRTKKEQQEDKVERRKRDRKEKRRKEKEARDRDRTRMEEAMKGWLQKINEQGRNGGEGGNAKSEEGERRTKSLLQPPLR